ncbi:hypothetical protein CAP31_09755 [Sulfuriferula sp. AH1]|nr:hypothetical protein CAP31_09755 [Sulfuriferula sp. AH1]
MLSDASMDAVPTQKFPSEMIPVAIKRKKMSLFNNHLLVKSVFVSLANDKIETIQSTELIASH